MIFSEKQEVDDVTVCGEQIQKCAVISEKRCQNIKLKNHSGKYVYICIQISTSDKNRILETFEKIESVLSRINSDHTRMININFILKQIFRITKLQYKNIPISK